MHMAEPINLEAFRQKKAQKLQKNWLGRFVWLYCPACETIEYSEVLSSFGRKHKCGTTVEEQEVELDLSVEATITLYNLGIIQAKLAEAKKGGLLKLAMKGMYKLLKQLEENEKTYLARLEAAGNCRLEPLEGEWEELKKNLPIKETNVLGLEVSEFRFDPMRRFRPNQKGERE